MLQAVSDQQSYYDSCYFFMIRCLQDRRRAEQQGLEAHDGRYSDFQAMSQLIQQFVRRSGITKVILLARISPGWSTSNSDIASDSSLSRQINFCQIFVDSIGVEVETLILDNVGAFRDDAIDAIEARLSHQQDVLVIIPSLDRLTRRMDHLTRFRALTNDNIWFMSLLWPHHLVHFPTIVQDISRHLGSMDIPDVLGHQVLSWLSLQQRLLSRRLYQCILLPTILDMSIQSIEQMIVEATSAAEQFVNSLRSQGSYRSIQVPTEMTAPSESNRGVNERMTQSWRRLISDYTGLQQDQCDIQYANSQSSHTCPCKQQLPPVHRADCSCVCDYCKRRRMEVCPCHQLRQCVCPIICHCSCDGICHKQATGE